MYSETLLSQAECSPSVLRTSNHHGNMTWAQVETFRAHLKRYQEVTKKTQAQVADDLGTTYGTLRFWLSGTRPPKVENMKKAATLFGCRVTDFIDDPMEVPPGIDPEKWTQVSEKSRVLASAMFEDLVSIPEAEQDAYYELWKKGVQIGLARRAAEQGTPVTKTGGRIGKKP